MIAVDTSALMSILLGEAKAEAILPPWRPRTTF
jgi:hypothetical protein